MAFFRTKKIKGIHYLYRVESYREGGRPRQRVIAYLGRAGGAANTGVKKEGKKKKTTRCKKPRNSVKASRRATLSKAKKQQPKKTR